MPDEKKQPSERLITITTRPVQQVAAEAATLDQFVRSLRPTIGERLAALVATGFGEAPLWGWPLIADPSLPPGFIHFRPHPRPDTTPETAQKPA